MESTKCLRIIRQNSPSLAVPTAMTDPLQQVLAAEAAARARIEETRAALEAGLRAARVDANRIKERNEQRTQAAIRNAERKCAAATSQAIVELDKEFRRQQKLGDGTIEERLERLIEQRVAQLWPGS